MWAFIPSTFYFHSLPRLILTDHKFCLCFKEKLKWSPWSLSLWFLYFPDCSQLSLEHCWTQAFIQDSPWSSCLLQHRTVYSKWQSHCLATGRNFKPTTQLCVGILDHNNTKKPKAVSLTYLPCFSIFRDVDLSWQWPSRWTGLPAGCRTLQSPLLNCLQVA